jgi:hypothetical protein
MRKTLILSELKSGVQKDTIGKKFVRHWTRTAFNTEDRLSAPHRLRHNQHLCPAARAVLRGRKTAPEARGDD